nr:hypothetical protein [Tanacetum cinerariifolium]
MMNEVDIENLTIEQYLMLTQEKQTHAMIRTESDRMITKNIDDITIAEYMKYEAEMRRDPRKYTRNLGFTTLGGIMSLENMHHPDKLKTNDYFPSIPICFEPAQPHTDDIHKPLGNKPNDSHLFTPQSYYETKEVSSDKDVDEWLNEELSKRMTGEDKEEEEDALIDILKIVVEERKLVYKKTQIRTPSRAGINMMPKSLFKHLKLANLKKTSMAIKIVIDTLETILLGRPFFATIHAQIDVFKGEILLGVRNEKVKFDMHGEICHSRVPLKFFTCKESVYTVDSSSNSQENEVGSHLFKIVSRCHVSKPVHITFKVYEEDCGIWPTCNPDLSFCSGENSFEEWMKIKLGHTNISDSIRCVIFKEWVKEDFNFGVNIGRTKDDPYFRNFNEYKDELDKESEQLWYDKGFEEEELWQNGIELIDYTPPLAKNETFEFYRYTFKNGKSFICITKQMNDVLPLGRVNRSRFIDKPERRWMKKEETLGKRSLYKKVEFEVPLTRIHVVVRFCPGVTTLFTL